MSPRPHTPRATGHLRVPKVEVNQTLFSFVVKKIVFLSP